MKDVITGNMTIADGRRIQQRISKRLNQLKKRKAELGDIEYLSIWTHKLYEIAKERDHYAQKLHYAKRAFIIAFSDPYDPRKDKKKERISIAMNKSRKLSWERAHDCDDCFDLQVKNTEDVDSDYLLKLLTIVDNASAGQNFNKKAFRQFEAWINNPNEVLPEFAFATLDSWSFSEGTNAKGKDKQTAARQLWDALFCSRPDGERRLTDPKISGGKKIIKERFDLWWPKGRGC